MARSASMRVQPSDDLDSGVVSGEVATYLLAGMSIFVLVRRAPALWRGRSYRDGDWDTPASSWLWSRLSWRAYLRAGFIAAVGISLGFIFLAVGIAMDSRLFVQFVAGWFAAVFLLVGCVALTGQPRILVPPRFRSATAGLGIRSAGRRNWVDLLAAFGCFAIVVVAAILIGGVNKYLVLLLGLILFVSVRLVLRRLG